MSLRAAAPRIRMSLVRSGQAVGVSDLGELLELMLEDPDGVREGRIFIAEDPHEDGDPPA